VGRPDVTRAPARRARSAPPPVGTRTSAPRLRLQSISRKGEVRFAVRTEHRLWGHRRTDGVPSLSVVKALLLGAYLDDPRVRGRPLRCRRPPPHRPDDPPLGQRGATRVLAFVGPARVRATARRVGMRRFAWTRRVGRSRIDASDQTRFFLHFEAHVVARHRATALHLLRTVVRSQRWGVAARAARRLALYFKGGWGAGTGLIEHQVALLRPGAIASRWPC
jgi:hypothetical protein